MANRRRDEALTNVTGKGHIKFRYSDSERYLDLDMDGIANDAVADGLRSIATALAGRAVLPSARVLPKTVAPTTTPEKELEVPTVGAVDEDQEGVLQDESATSADAETDDRPKRRPAPKAPKFLNDLDLTKASIPLADFVQQKNPGGDMQRFAVIATWFKENLNAEEITIDHVFTAYKSLGWEAQLPDDLGQTFRNLKSNKNWFDSGAKRGAYKINWNGSSAVTKMGAVKP
jgi:hypothetical protein